MAEEKKLTLDEWMIAIAKINECVNYPTFCKTLEIGESNYTFEYWQRFNKAVRFLTVEVDEIQWNKLIPVGEGIFAGTMENEQIG